MGCCCLPAKQDYWVQRQHNSCLPYHWIDGLFSRDKFEYVWQNMLMDSSLLDEEFDNTIGEGLDGEFEGVEEVIEVIEVKTVRERRRRRQQRQRQHS